ncbi:MAG: hypothetical protein CVT84_12570 [Alphaproteobacteria bacterium HGW-Alphaproteobacteria-6]|nr:MAG: hypothetical protein CVT84_12570 [Alphaproteobacteria bacterium HGW-Alphaproteobacteria-6]
MAHPKGSRERAAAFRAATGQPHRVGAGWSRFKERTLRDWVRSAETGGGDALMPVARSDKGKRRVRITRRWQNGCGLPGEVQDCIADKLERIARGLILKGRSDRETQRLAATELQRLSVEAGVKLPKKQLAALCRLNCACVRRFDEMKAARDYSADHKRYSDSHEYRVQRTLTRASMEVLMGDVHRIDLSVADAVQSRDPRIHLAANEAEKTGRKTLRVAIIGWMDGSSHYFWATPVILGPGQGITQLDVARSLHGVVTCPWGGIPREIVIDNGGEYGALAEAVALRRRSRGASLHL